MKIFILSICLLALAHSALGETGCPPAEDVLPCTCINAIFTYLECKELHDSEVLRTVFQKSERYRYKEVHIEYSSLQYLPHEMFEIVEVAELHFKNVTLAQLFDSPPHALDKLRILHIENTILLRGILWQLLEPLKGLKILNVYYNVVRSLGKDFSQYAPKGLEQLSFYGTETKTLSSGVFADFPHLDKIAIDAGKLTELKRDIFPVPFNGRVLYFNYNTISSIADDLFTQMPNLQTLGLRQNQISTVPESAFEGNAARITYLRLDENPLKCDCLLIWLIKNKPASLGGTCASPKTLYGKELSQLTTSDFNC